MSVVYSVCQTPLHYSLPIMSLEGTPSIINIAMMTTKTQSNLEQHVKPPENQPFLAQRMTQIRIVKSMIGAIFTWTP